MTLKFCGLVHHITAALTTSAWLTTIYTKLADLHVYMRPIYNASCKIPW